MKPYYEEPNITIYNGDCLEVMKDLSDKSIDCVVTSPPYGVGKDYEKGKSLNDLVKLIHGLFNVVTPKLKDDGQVFINFDDPFVEKYHIGKDYFEAATKNNLEFSGNRIWKKDPSWMNSPWISCSNYPVLEWEYLWTFSKGKRPLKKEFAKVANRGIWEFKSLKAFKQHPAEFPIGLPTRAIEIYTNEGDIVLDPFLGSGTTARACKDLGRKCIGIEISKEYCDIAVQRLGQEVLL